MNESVKLKLLKGTQFNIKKENENICYIKPLTLCQIVDIGLDKYNLYLSSLVAEVSDYNIQDIDLSNYTYWDILINIMYYGDKSYYEAIIEAMSIFLDQEITFNKQEKLFYTQEGKTIDKDIFDEVKQILKWQNCLRNNSIEEEKYENERARKLAEKFKKFREQLKPKKSENSITLEDMISGVSARHSSINLYNIWDLTLYQLYDQFNRLNLVDNYNASIFLLPYSEDASKNIKHWATTIIKEDDI